MVDIMYDIGFDVRTYEDLCHSLDTSEYVLYMQRYRFFFTIPNIL